MYQNRTNLQWKKLMRCSRILRQIIVLKTTHSKIRGCQAIHIYRVNIYKMPIYVYARVNTYYYINTLETKLIS